MRRESHLLVPEKALSSVEGIKRTWGRRVTPSVRKCKVGSHDLQVWGHKEMPPPRNHKYKVY